MHFTEWRHANAMKCLGIPYSRHFFQISKIEDVQALWEQIRAQSKDGEIQARSDGRI